MELQPRIDSLEKQLRTQGLFLRITFGLLILTIGFLVTRWVLATEGRLDIQGERVYVHRGGQPWTSTIRPHGLEAHRFEDPSEPYGSHVLLRVLPREGAELSLTENSANQNRDLRLFIAGDQSGFSIRDSQQRERISLALSADGPKLRLLDENGLTVFQAP
jgi:hypothetical protein